jgi:phenylacetate-CoA ligase
MPTLRPGQLFDPRLEAQTAAERREYLGSRLQKAVARAHAHAPNVRQRREEANLTPADVTSLGDLRKLPITHKDELPKLQAAELPFGGLLATAVGKLRRIYMSPGPNYVPEPDTDDFWRGRMALVAAGFQPGDLVQNTLSYHLSPGGFMFDSALRSLGCVVVPAGVGQTDLQVRVAFDAGVSGYVGTPSFLRTLLTRARELGKPLRIEVAFVTAEMLPESLRSELETEFGVRVLQGYGTADVGVLAYECTEKAGLHLHPEVIVEVLDLETAEPAAAGQPGQVVATIFDEVYPLLRFATGDISAFAPEADCPCGRTARRLAGLLGRIGDAVKVKGMFIRGTQMDEVFQKFPAVVRFQAVVTREHHQDQLTYVVELAEPVADPNSWVTTLAAALRDALKVRGELRVVPPGTIPQGAKKISDQRVWR